MNARQIAESSTLAVIARISMIVTPALFSILASIAWYWLVSIQSDVNAAQVDISVLRERTSVVENNQVRGRAAREDWQQQTTEQIREMTAQFRELNASLSAINTTVATLATKLEAQEKRIDQRR